VTTAEFHERGEARRLARHERAIRHDKQIAYALAALDVIVIVTIVLTFLYLLRIMQLGA
jgi:hypothetical protein